MMRKKIVCIFAHPDDEAFGPAGTIAKLTQTHDVFLICATSGEHGANPAEQNLGEERRRELKQSASILGIKTVYFLGYEDGTLCNNTYHAVAADIRKILDDLRPELLATDEPRGVSGHLDHIAISMICSYLFEELSYVKKIMYYCISRERRSRVGDYFIYFPPGYDKTEVDEIIDVTDFWDKKTAAIRAHTSQVTDGERILKELETLPKQEYFFVRRK